MYVLELKIRKITLIFLYCIFFLSQAIPAIGAGNDQVTIRRRRVLDIPSPSDLYSNQIKKVSSNFEIRIGLATNADFATISCNGAMAELKPDTFSKGLNRISENKITLQLNVGESRQQRNQGYRVQVARFKTSSEAKGLAAKLENRFSEPVKIHYDNSKNNYSVTVGNFDSPSDAQVMMVRVLNAGYSKPYVESDRSEGLKRSSGWTIRGVSNGREITHGSNKLTLISLDDSSAPLKYLNSTYRGKLEVSVNRRQRLTVVNILPLEDYVKGVVPNELSPVAFPQLEALKAQAIAARTYAVRNKGQFSEEGFDLLPTALSQVYGGKSSEHPLTDQAVQQTRGIIATYNNEPINALYTSTSGGRTENSEFVFEHSVPYLKSVVTAPEISNNRWLKSERTVDSLTDIEGRPIARELARLILSGFNIPEKISPSFLSAPANAKECTQWIDKLSFLSRHTNISRSLETVDLGNFSQLLLEALYGDESPAKLFTQEDVRYLLGQEYSLASEVYARNIAFLIREGLIHPYSDGMLRVIGKLSRAYVLSTIARALDSRHLFRLETGTARPFDRNNLTVKFNKTKEEKQYRISPKVFIFRKMSSDWFPASSIQIIGGETIAFHLDENDRIDYLEVSPVLNGGTSDRFSQFSWWDIYLTPEQVRSQVAKAKISVGKIIDLHPEKYGISNRVAQLRIVGSDSSTLINGVHIRSVLGVRETLFVIERELDETGRVKLFHIRGRGWGHGVGMCQVGAYGLAMEGYSYDRILKHFYSNIQLTKIY